MNWQKRNSKIAIYTKKGVIVVVGKTLKPRKAFLDGVFVKRDGRLALTEGFKMFLMLLPCLILVFIFTYMPLAGWRYAFYYYRPGFPLDKCPFVGFYWFKSLFGNSYQVSEIIRVLKNTIGISLLNMASSILPVIFAIFLNEIRSVKYRKLVQITTTLPNFVSWVLVYSFAFSMFSTDAGFINRLLMALNITDKGINFLASGNHVWLTMTAWSVWKSLGWSAIMYIAAIAGIDQELYEAARIDGAGRFGQIWYITVPGIMPTFFTLLILSVGNMLSNGMDQYLVFQNGMNKSAIEVLDLYVYNVGLGSSNFSLATTISILKSIISVVLLLLANGASKLVRGETIM